WVFGEKQCGLIVDYVGIFRNLQKALAIYGTGGTGAGGGGGTTPIRPKEELVEELKKQLEGTLAFCRKHGVDVEDIVPRTGFERIAKLEDAREALLASEDVKKQFLALAAHLKTLYKAVLPDPAASAYTSVVSTLTALADMIRATSAAVSIEEVMGE